MPNLLHLDSSADLRNSRSRTLTATFAEAWRAGGPDNLVTRRDLHRDALPHLPDPALHWPARLRPAGAAPPAEIETLQREVLAELLAADVVLVGVALYNYSVPSTLKAWLDYIHVPGLTAEFDGPGQQPLAGRPAVVVTSQGGTYDPGTPTEGWDLAVPLLEIILGAKLGMDVTTVTVPLGLADTVERLADQRERAAGEYARAQEAMATLARTLG